MRIKGYLRLVEDKLMEGTPAFCLLKLGAPGYTFSNVPGRLHLRSRRNALGSVSRPRSTATSVYDTDSGPDPVEKNP